MRKCKYADAKCGLMKGWWIVAFRRVKMYFADNGLTETELKRVLSHDGFPGEREKKPKRLAWLTKLLKNEKFSRCDWALCLCHETGEVYRVNGQHTSYLLNKIVEGEIEALFPEGIPVLWEEWECDTTPELADVFDQFDNRNSSREPQDKLGVYRSQHDDISTVNKKLISSILTGVVWGINHDDVINKEIPLERRPESSSERGKMLNIPSVREFILFVADRDDASFKQWLERSGLVAFFFHQFLTMPREKFRVRFDMIAYEVRGAATEFTEWVRKQSSKSGMDAGRYYRELKKAYSNLEKEIRGTSIKELDKKIEEAKNPKQEGEDAA